jgi:hypothetical protein
MLQEVEIKHVHILLHMWKLNLAAGQFIIRLN